MCLSRIETDSFAYGTNPLSLETSGHGDEGYGAGIGQTLWSRITKNPDVSTGPHTRPFAHLLAPLTHLLALPCSLCSHALLHSLIHLLAHFAHSLAHGKVID